jgi:hypothetical protein
MFPWFTANVPREEEVAFVGNLPGPLQFAYRKRWKPAFARHQTLVECIYDPRVPPPHTLAPMPCCWCCA